MSALRSLAATTAATAVALIGSLLLATTPASAAGGVCDDLDTGRVNVTGNQQTVTATAPTGSLITGYCVKSSSGGTAPEYVTLAEPLGGLVLRHSGGGQVIHYSLSFGAVAPEPEPEPQPEPESQQPFDWNWTYPEPSCDALTVTYPADLPSGQSNDVNIRLETDQGQVTLNYHHDTGTWSGTTGFTYSQHRLWPEGVRRYAVTWVQVAGTNYHWQGRQSCVTDGDASTLDTPRAVTSVAGFDGGSVRVARGRRARTDVVTTDELGLTTLDLQRRTPRGWRDVSRVTARDGRARVVFPRETRRGTRVYRLAADATGATTGAVTRPLRVRVR